MTISQVIIDLYGSQSAFRLRVDRCMLKMKNRAGKRPVYPETPVKVQLAKQRCLK